MMRIGDLDKRITLQAPTLAPDSMGGFTTTYVDITTVWAKAWTVSSSDQQQGGQAGLIRVQKFCIRFRTVLKSAWRIRWDSVSGTRYFAITGIDPDGKNEWIYLTCKETSA